MQTVASPNCEPFTVFDWLGTIVAGFTIVGLLLFPLVGRTFHGMFEHFGSQANLPLLPRLSTLWWFPLVFALAVAGFLALGLRSRTPLPQRRAPQHVACPFRPFEEFPQGGRFFATSHALKVAVIYLFDPDSKTVASP
jgi:hypothetical protein